MGEGKEDSTWEERHDTNSTPLLSLTGELLKNNVWNRKAWSETLHDFLLKNYEHFPNLIIKDSGNTGIATTHEGVLLVISTLQSDQISFRWPVHLLRLTSPFCGWALQARRTRCRVLSSQSRTQLIQKPSNSPRTRSTSCLVTLLPPAGRSLSGEVEPSYGITYCTPCLQERGRARVQVWGKNEATWKIFFSHKLFFLILHLF